MGYALMVNRFQLVHHECQSRHGSEASSLSHLRAAVPSGLVRLRRTLQPPFLRPKMTDRFLPAWHIAQRLLLAVAGGYFLAAGVAALMALALSRVMPPSEASALMAMLSFPIYLVVLLWAFADRRQARLWWLLGLGGPLMFGVAAVLTALTGVPDG